ncbi:MAG: DEAD/DEAH box helicase [Pseudomonadota bacterium]
MATPRPSLKSLRIRTAALAEPAGHDAVRRRVQRWLDTRFHPAEPAVPGGLFPPTGGGAAEISPARAEEVEAIGFSLLRQLQASGEVEPVRRELFWPAFRLRRALPPEASAAALLPLALMAIDGVLAHREPELRLALSEALPADLTMPEADPWGEQLMWGLCASFLLLVRRDSARGDLPQAQEIIAALRARQAACEPGFLEPPGLFEAAPQRALEVAALYNLLRACEIGIQFCSGGFQDRRGRDRLSARGVQDEIDRHVFTARELSSGCRPDLHKLALRLGMACKALIAASIYATLLPRRTRELLRAMSRPGKEVSALWYSQREALGQGLLDPTKVAVVLSMPTSAGKTLLAEFAISNIDPEEGRVVYLAPTRALVTQICLILRRDLGGLNLKVQVATPSFELNPIEDEVLSQSFDVLVTTPEKLDLLLRADHAAVREISLVVVDEAHGLHDRERGARLELLLATLRRERPGVRFLLMTPFARNAGSLSSWLGGPQGGQPIVVDWRPNERVVGSVWPGRKLRDARRPLRFMSLASAHSDCPAGVASDLGPIPDSAQGIGAVALEAARLWAEAQPGGVLLLARSRSEAMERAAALARGRSAVQDEVVERVTRYLDAEVGAEHPLSASLRHGVAFHHAGLSSEARFLVERLVESQRVRIVCATTTLAQGVHFPLSVAIVESIQRRVWVERKPEHHDMPPSEFWNIVGRVGRAGEDQLGSLVFALPFSKKEREKKEGALARYLADDAAEVASTLLPLVRELARGRAITFNTPTVEEHRGLSAFLQYVLHAVAVSGSRRIHQELEGLLRSSLVFQQASEESPELADALIRLGRAYVDDLVGGKRDRLDHYARMADGTGFSSPSIDMVTALAHRDDWASTRPGDWSGDALFPAGAAPSDLLVKVIEALRRVPEVRLGSEDKGEFNAERIARIATAWVHGQPLSELASQEYHGDLMKCCQHLYGTVSDLLPWGLRAVNRIVGPSTPEGTPPPAELSAAMAFHGVKSPEAIALRMNGVPRVAAEGLADVWRAEGRASFQEVHAWLEGRTARDWQVAMGPQRWARGEDARWVWEVLEGQRGV